MSETFRNRLLIDSNAKQLYIYVFTTVLETEKLKFVGCRVFLAVYYITDT